MRPSRGQSQPRRIDPCNLLFDFYCIVADPALSSNETNRRDRQVWARGDAAGNAESGLWTWR